MASHNTLGKKGEEIAKAYLEDLGYKILATNWFSKKTELDLIALKEDILVVVEVKTRTYRFIENLNEIVTPRKQKSIIKATDAYIEAKELKNEVRFDIIFIVMPDYNYTLEHVINAFTTVG